MTEQTEGRLTVTRNNIRNWADGKLKEGVKPTIEMLLNTFEEKNIAALKVHFREWREENQSVLKSCSAYELQLRAKNQQLEEEKQRLIGEINSLSIEHSLALQRLNSRESIVVSQLNEIEDFRLTRDGEKGWFWEYDGLQGTTYSAWLDALEDWIQWAVTELQNGTPPCLGEAFPETFTNEVKPR